MLDMQRLTKPEYTIYLLWKKNRRSLQQGAGASTKIVLPEKIRLDNGRETNLIRIEKCEKYYGV